MGWLTMTLEEQRAMARRVFRDRWPTDCQYAVDERLNPANRTNYDLVNKIVTMAEKAGSDFGEEALWSAVMELRAQNLLERKQTIVINAGPKEVDPKTRIPHRDLFPNVKGIESAIRYIKTAKIPSNQIAAINELLAYVKQHDIHDVDQPHNNQPAGSVVTAPQARALVDNLKITDLGATNSSAQGGKWAQLLNAQKRLHKLIDGLVRERVPEPKIIAAVREEIDALSSSSIRG